MIITLESLAPSTINHIIDFVDDTFGDRFDLFELGTAIKSLKDNYTVIFDSNSGDVEVRIS